MYNVYYLSLLAKDRSYL